MRIVGLSSKVGVGLEIFTKDQLSLIHSASLRVLQETGVAVFEEEARQLLLNAGYSASGKVIRIPEHLVSEALRSAPESITLSRRGRVVYHVRNSPFKSPLSFKG